MLPKIAIIDSNTLAAIGLKNIIQSVVPMMSVDTHYSFNSLIDANAESYVHYFVSVNIALANMPFFLSNRRKTIVLTTSSNPNSQLRGFHCLCVDVTERELIKNLLALVQTAHRGGRNLPPVPPTMNRNVLSDREIEVMSLIVKGFINKEIADRLNIGLATVITHRRNIMEKLNVKSVSALTIYAVTHGYVDINNI